MNEKINWIIICIDLRDMLYLLVDKRNTLTVQRSSLLTGKILGVAYILVYLVRMLEITV